MKFLNLFNPFFWLAFFTLALTAATPASKGRGYIERANVLTGVGLNNSAPTVFGKEIPLGEGWYKATIRYNLAVTIGTGTTPIAEGELLICQNVMLRTDRGEILCNLPGRALYKIATYLTGQPPRKDAIAAATATYRVNLPIIFADNKMNRPEDTILDTNRYNSITLQMTMGGVAQLFTTVGTSSVIQTMDMEVERSLGQLPKEAQPYFHVSFDFRQPVDAATTTNIELEKSPDAAIKRLYVHSSSGGTAGLPFGGVNADDVQSIITLKDQNRFIEKERIHAMIQDMNKLDAMLETIIVGIEVFDFVRDGAIQSALATGNKSVLQYSWTNVAGVAANDIVTLAAEMVRSLK
jgi:hypothetical protein